MTQETPKKKSRNKWYYIKEYRRKNRPEIAYPQVLPIIQKKDLLIKTIKEHDIIILSGETGSGKTTQLPKICLEAGRGVKGKIGCTQPRRIAATSVAKYVDTQVSAPRPAVSCKIRFFSNDNDHIFVKFMTDGILLKEIESDPLLRQYDTLIIDEIHERSLNIDFILGYLKKIAPKRPDLKIILSSATVETEVFSKFFDKAHIVNISGRTYPVTLLWDPPDYQIESNSNRDPLIEKTVQTACDLLTEPKGDILVFMPTQASIRETMVLLQKEIQEEAEILPLYSRLSKKDQDRIFLPSNKKKIIVTTNIAETSVTIPGIRYVIDTGLARISRYCPKNKIGMLPIENISQSSAKQRMGRCGRMEHGICIRLYDELEFSERDQFTPPEIVRSDLASVLLQMLVLPLGKVEDFPFINSPSKQAFKAAYQTLYFLRAIDDNQKLTPHGRKIARIPLDPRLSSILIEAINKGIFHEALIICAVLSIADPLERPMDKEDKADQKHALFKDSRSDFLTYINIWNAYQELKKGSRSKSSLRRWCRDNFLSYNRMREWNDLYQELQKVMDETRNSPSKKAYKPLEKVPYDRFHKALLRGFLSQIAQKDQKTKVKYQGPRNLQLFLFPGSVLFSSKPEWVMAAQFIETSRLFARTIGKVRPEWIESAASHLVTKRYENIRWHRAKGHVYAQEYVSLWGLTLAANRNVHYGNINREKAREIFIQEAIIENQIDGHFGFIKHLFKEMGQIQLDESKLRDHCLLISDEDLFNWFYERFPDIVSVAELRKWQHKNPKDQSLFIPSNELRQDDEDIIDRYLFPNQLYLGSIPLDLEYIFDIESKKDGLTLLLPLKYLRQFPLESADWIIPGWLEEKIYALLSSLPKDVKTKCPSIKNLSSDLMEHITPYQGSLLFSLIDLIKQKEQLTIFPGDFDLTKVPLHLKINFALIDHQGKRIAESQDLSYLKRKFGWQPSKWGKVPPNWIEDKIANWNFDSLPDTYEVTASKGFFSHQAFAGLEVIDGRVNKTLFPSKKERDDATRKATKNLLEIALEEDLYGIHNALQTLPRPLLQYYKKNSWGDDLYEDSYKCFVYSFLTIDELITNQEDFNKLLKSVREKLKSLLTEWQTLITRITKEHQELLDYLKKLHRRPFNKLLAVTMQEVEEALDQQFYSSFIAKNQLKYLTHYPRYLQAMQTRLQRAVMKPQADNQKSLQFSEMQASFQLLEEFKNIDNPQIQAALREFKFLLDELKVSIFAQDLGTTLPVSPKRLKKRYQEICQLILSLPPSAG